MGYFTDITIKCPFCHKEMTISLDFSHSKFERMDGFYCHCEGCGWQLEKIEMKFDSKNPQFIKCFEKVYSTTYLEMFNRWCGKAKGEY
jgi:hypothetical protein